MINVALAHIHTVTLTHFATIEAIEASASVEFTRWYVSRTYHKYLLRSEAEYFTKLMLGLLIVSLIVNSVMKNASLLQQSSFQIEYGSEFTIVRTGLSDEV